MMFLIFVELLLIGVGLSMDAFAVSVCKGLSMRKFSMKQSCIIGLFFGGFQALMPLLGWVLGRQFELYIRAFDHWIAFVLLAFIGGKMIFESFKANDKNEESDIEQKLDIKELFVLAIATSIDALAIGVTFAFLRTNIWEAISIIGSTTFILSIIGVVIGHKFGSKCKNKAILAGGIILILIGVKILIEHLF